MSQTPSPQSPPALKLKVPGSTVGGPKLKPPGMPALSSPPAPALSPTAGAPSPALPSPALSAPPMPAVPGPTPGPIPAAPPPPTAIPSVPQSPSVPSAPVAPPSIDASAVSEAELPATEDAPLKGKKKSSKKASSAAPKAKAKPSILFLLLDFLIFGGAVTLAVLIFLKS